MSRFRSIRIGVIADTHGRLDPAIPKMFHHIDRSLLPSTYLKTVLC